MSDDLPPQGLTLPDRLARIAEQHPPADTTPAPDEAMPTLRDAQRASFLERWHRVVPHRFWEAKLAAWDGAPFAEKLAAWADDETPDNLVLVGPVGVGKTHAAVAACRQHVAHGAGLEFWPVGELLDALDWRRPESAATLARFMSVDLLIVDDLGAERANEWTGERLYAVVNRRWLENRPTIVTTNLEPEALEAAIGQRTYSRLAHDALAVAIGGDDRRRA